VSCDGQSTKQPWSQARRGGTGDETERSFKQGSISGLQVTGAPPG
jgi:hypothetical protein